MKNQKMNLIIILVGMLLVLPLSNASAAVGWEEDFTDLDDWTISYFKANPPDEPSTKRSETGFSLKNGVLTAPNDQGFDYMVNAEHNSSISYGTWSFDWNVELGTTHLAYDFVIFMYYDPFGVYDGIGLTAWDFLENKTGYALSMISSSETPYPDSFSAPGMTLFKYPSIYPVGVSVIKTHAFSSDIVGSHSVRILRSLEGVFHVYFDDVLIIEAIDTSYSISEKFVFGSSKGDSGFDNVSVNDDPVTITITPTTTSTTTTTTTTTTTDNGTGFPSIAILLSNFGILVIYRKRFRR